MSWMLFIPGAAARASWGLLQGLSPLLLLKAQLSLSFLFVLCSL